MIKVFRYRLYPTKRQEETLTRHLGICAELYNAALQERRDAWEIQRKRISWFDQSMQLADIKDVREDVAEVSRKVLESTLKRVDLAFQAFFKRTQRGRRGYPRFRSSRRYDSMTFQKLGNALNGNKVRLPRLGWFRIKIHRPMQGKIKTLTVKRESGRWFAMFAVEYPIQPLPFSADILGIDVGLTSFATLSNGRKIDNPRWFRSAQAKLRRLQRRVARRKKGSSRRRKAVLLLARWHSHIRDQRRDFHHKESRKIVKENGLIAVEDLNVTSLARTRLAKSIHDAGWSNFLNMLTYKAEDAGRLLVKVDPRGTSQTCICGAEVRKTLAIREHRCLSCGLVADRDHVSAQIILQRAVSLSGANVGDLIPCVA